MKQSRGFAPTTVGKNRTDVGSRVAAFLRRLHPAKTAEFVAADTGISVHTVARWFDRDSAPSAAALIRLVSTYGPEFLATIMGDLAPQWLRQDAHAEKRAAIEARMRELEDELEAL